MVIGFLGLNAVVLACVVTVQGLGWFPNPPLNLSAEQYAALMAFSVIGGILGGIAAGVVAGRAPLAHGAAIGGAILVMAIGDTHRQWIDPQGAPHWVLLGLLVAGPIGILVGGFIEHV